VCVCRRLQTLEMAFANRIQRKPFGKIAECLGEDVIYNIQRLFVCQTKYGKSICCELDHVIIHLPKIYAKTYIIAKGEVDTICPTFTIQTNFIRKLKDKTVEFPILTILQTGCIFVI